MSGKTVMDRFIQKTPLAVMTRCIVGTLMGDRLDEVFDQNRGRQYDDTIKFSTVAMTMAEIALGTLKNRNQAYRKYKQELQTSVEAYYGKLNRTAPHRASPKPSSVTSPDKPEGCSRRSAFNLGKCCRDIAASRSMAIICRKPRSV